ncbi:glycosyltransferase [Candidatus Woesearchaeota archaeon]|nr:glycosyltransferase [Candidatus Woesearchaeota archaeon]
MKIYLIYDFLTEPGGLERLMANHAKMLKEDGFEVEVLTYHYNEEVIKRAGFESITIKNISVVKTRSELINIFLSVFLSFFGINKLRDCNPDLFITYSFPANYLIRNKRIRRINYMNHYPHFLYLKGKEKTEWASSIKGFKRWAVTISSWFLGWYFKKLDVGLVRKSDLNFANSNFTKKRLDKVYNTKCIVSYPPISKIFTPSKTKIEDRYIFAAGRIIPDKKYDWLIESCSLMKNKLPLYISGDGGNEYVEKLTKLAKENEVEIRFVDRSLKNLIVYYTNAAAFGFSTPGEDFGLVPAESLACGTPVVVWGDGAGPTEQVIDGVNGYYANPYDLKDFAAKLDKIIDTNLKTRNRKEIIASSKKFSYEEVKMGFIKEIKMILGKKFI